LKIRLPTNFEKSEARQQSGKLAIFQVKKMEKTSESANQEQVAKKRDKLMERETKRTCEGTKKRTERSGKEHPLEKGGGICRKHSKSQVERSFHKTEATECQRPRRHSTLEQSKHWKRINSINKLHRYG